MHHHEVFDHESSAQKDTCLWLLGDLVASIVVVSCC